MDEDIFLYAAFGLWTGAAYLVLGLAGGLAALGGFLFVLGLLKAASSRDARKEAEK